MCFFCLGRNKLSKIAKLILESRVVKSDTTDCFTGQNFSKAISKATETVETDASVSLKHVGILPVYEIEQSNNG